MDPASLGLMAIGSLMGKGSGDVQVSQSQSLSSNIQFNPNITVSSPNTTPSIASTSDLGATSTTTPSFNKTEDPSGFIPSLSLPSFISAGGAGEVSQTPSIDEGSISAGMFDSQTLLLLLGGGVLLLILFKKR